MSGSNLLIDEHPLQVLPSLAVAIGLNEAMFVQQLHYWLKHKERDRDARFFKDGRWWTYNTYPEWHAQFPFWSLDTLKRVVRSVERSGYVLSTHEHNERKGDQTKWYSIDYEALENGAEGGPEKAEEGPSDFRAESHIGADQCAESHGQECNLHPPIVQSAPHQWGNLPSPLIDPETTTETTAETDGRPSGENARAKGSDLVAAFFDALEEARAERGTPKADRRPVSRKQRGKLARDVGAELADGRYPELVEKAARRIALRWDAYPMELAEAIGDVLDGKPWRVEDEGISGGSRASPGKNGSPVPPAAHPNTGEAARRRREGYEWLFD